MPGWNEHVQEYKSSATLWNNVWLEVGCPRAGIIFELRNKTKKAYKYAVRCIKRRQAHIRSDKLGAFLSTTEPTTFWKQAKAMKSSSQSVSPIVDGHSCDTMYITDNFRANFSSLLNKNKDETCERDALLEKVTQLFTTSDLSNVDISVLLVCDALRTLGRDKTMMTSSPQIT